METKDISILLLAETNLTLSKAIQYLIININRESSFKCFFFIDNILVLFGGRVIRQAIDIQMGMNCAPLLVDLILPAYEADFSKRGSQEIEN